MITVIIPIYNVSKYLKNCLESVINQTYKNLEIICINDGSTDNSLQILKEYKERDERIIIIDKKNAGVSAARNDGIEKASGEYLFCVDGDDYIDEDFFEKFYNKPQTFEMDTKQANELYINKELNGVLILNNYQLLPKF